jgi:hypothetical protein
VLLTGVSHHGCLCGLCAGAKAQLLSCAPCCKHTAAASLCLLCHRCALDLPVATGIVRLHACAALGVQRQAAWLLLHVLLLTAKLRLLRQQICFVILQRLQRQQGPAPCCPEASLCCSWGEPAAGTCQACSWPHVTH